VRVARLPEMRITRRALATGTVWTIAAYGVVQIVRFVTNILLTRLLAPELFGIMVIINTFRTGAELVSDVAIGQNIIRSPHGEEPAFYNSAWTLQVIRGFLLYAIGCAAAFPLSNIYEVPVLLLAQPVAALVFVFSGFASVSPFLAQRKMDLAAFSKYEISAVLLWALAQIVLAYLIPSIWALVSGLVIGSAATLLCSYALLPAPRPSFTLNREYSIQIISFAKWIFFSSIIFFLSMSFDRLYLAGVVSLALLGVYGIARSIADLLSLLIMRLCGLIVFPFIASSANANRAELREKVVSIRLLVVLAASLGFACFAATADLLIKLILDVRYHDAGWMLPILIIGAWAATICSLNEYSLLGLGKPMYGAVANGLKLVCLLIGLPLGFTHFGMTGVVGVVAGCEFCRYAPLLAGQMRERFCFFGQDVISMIALFGSLAVLEWLRWYFGFGLSFSS
jgi:O-antigen/teichoic acid export membrane protein